MLLRSSLFIFLLLISVSSFGQIKASEFEKVKSVDIPFKFINGFIVVDLSINGKLPLKFIVDTGAQHTIITEHTIFNLPFVNKFLNIDFNKKIKIYGADLSTQLNAFIAKDIDILFSNVEFNNQNILLMESGYFSFEEEVGIHVHGILGMNIFRQFVLQFDFKRKVIKLINPVFFQPPDDYETLDLTFQKGKPYITTSLEFQDSTSIDVKLLLDTGATLSLLLYTDTHPKLKLPENAIPGGLGRGLGGNLMGFLGRIDRMNFGDLKLDQIIAHFQEKSPLADSTYKIVKNGILGSEILSRYNFILNSVNRKIYLKSNSKYRKPLVFDRSGLKIIATGKNLKTFIIKSIVKNSPADLAGLEINDVILSINYFPSKLMELKNINNRFRKKIGKKIKLSVKRGEEKLKFHFQLKDLI